MADKLTKVTGKESLKKYFDSAYIGAYSIIEGSEPIVTVAEVMHGTVTLDAGRKEDHVILNFVERSVPGMSEVKPLILNATNLKTIEKLYGKGADAVVGKKVQFYIDPAVKAKGGGTTEGVRIRPLVPKEAAPVPPCFDCKSQILAANGKPPAFIAQYTLKRYDVPLCAACAAKRNAAQQEAAEVTQETTETTPPEPAPETEGATDATE